MGLRYGFDCIKILSLILDPDRNFVRVEKSIKLLVIEVLLDLRDVFELLK